MNCCVQCANVSKDIAGQSWCSELKETGKPRLPIIAAVFTSSIANGNLHISSNTPPLNGDEEHALEEEFASVNASALTHLDDDCYTPNFDSFSQIVKDAEVEEVTRRAEKRPVQDASGKGKKVSKKSNRVSEMTVALNSDLFRRGVAECDCVMFTVVC